MPPQIRVLCVDDDANLVDLVATFLEQNAEDVTATAATSGQETIELLSNQRIDCVVSDYEMPGMDGLELLKVVRDDYPELPFLLFTGRGSEDVASRAVATGVTDYIPKSTGTEQYDLLANRVRNAVERTRATQTNRELFNAATDAIVVHDVETGSIIDVNRAGIDLWGYSKEELIGQFPSDLVVTPSDANGGWLADPSEDNDHPIDWLCETRSGDQFWAEVRLKKATIDGERRSLAIARDVTERKRREETLAALLTASHNLVGATTNAEVASLVVEAMRSVLEFEGVRLYLSSNGSASMNPAATAGEMPETMDEEELLVQIRDLMDRERDADERETGMVVLTADRSCDTSLRCFPVGEHGVIVGGLSEGAQLDDYTSDLIQLLVATTEGALDRAARDRALQRQHEELASLNHTNEVIRDINQTLVRVSTRDEIEALVCKQLAVAKPFVCAWIGEHDLTAQKVIPRSSAGRGAENHEDECIPTDDDSTDPLTSVIDRVIEDRNVVVLRDVSTKMLGSSRAELARSHGYQSLGFIPIVYQNALYDILIIYAETQDAFGETERDVLGELGETIGYALHTAERTRAVLTNTTVEVEYRIRDSDSLLIGLSNALDTRVELARMFVRSDGSTRLFLAVDDATQDDVREHLETIAPPGSSDVRIVAERSDGTLFEILVPNLPLVNSLADDMATLKSATANEGEARVVIELPSSASVRTLTENLESIYDDVSLLARRQRDPGSTSMQNYGHPLDVELTDRQHEVLLTAYHAGFFSWPRESTGEEIAELLEVSQPTFHEHLRSGERKILETLFEGRRSIYT